MEEMKMVQDNPEDAVQDLFMNRYSPASLLNARYSELLRAFLLLLMTIL